MISCRSTLLLQGNPSKEELSLRQFAVASLYQQAFFKDLKDQYNILLENLVYYRGETHYFVMTIKKSSLLDRGVFKEVKDEASISELLDPSNIVEENLIAVARDIATCCGIPTTCEILTNHLNKPDVQLFDFSQRTQTEEAAKLVPIPQEGSQIPSSEIEAIEEEGQISNPRKSEQKSSETKAIEKEQKSVPNHQEGHQTVEKSESKTKVESKIVPEEGHQTVEKSESKCTEIIKGEEVKVLVTLVGDALLEPFWPLGTGCNRAVLSALDAAWMVHDFATQKPIDEILQIRQSCYIKMKSALAETFTESSKTCVNPYLRYNTKRLGVIPPERNHQDN